MQLALGRGKPVLIGAVQLPRGYLRYDHVQRIAELPFYDDAVVIRQRHYAHRTQMAYIIPAGFVPVRQAHAVVIYVQQRPVVGLRAGNAALLELRVFLVIVFPHV